MEGKVLQKVTQIAYHKIPLEASKSESNRALIINALGGHLSELQNISKARDTQTMIRLLKVKRKH